MEQSNVKKGKPKIKKCKIGKGQISSLQFEVESDQTWHRAMSRKKDNNKKIKNVIQEIDKFLPNLLHLNPLEIYLYMK